MQYTFKYKTQEVHTFTSACKHSRGECFNCVSIGDLRVCVCMFVWWCRYLCVREFVRGLIRFVGPLAIYECVGVCSCVCVCVCVRECFTFATIGDLLVSVYVYECVRVCLCDRVCVRPCFSFVHTRGLCMRDFVCKSA